MSDESKDQEGFQEAMLRSFNESAKKRAFVLFSSPVCQPCQRMKKTIERMEAEGDKIDLFYINVFHVAAIALESKVRAVPTLMRFEEGVETARLTGEQTEAKLREFFDA